MSTLVQQKLRLKDRRRRFLYAKVGVLAFVLAAVITGLWVGARRPEVTISEIRVEGAGLVTESLVRDVIAHTLDGSYLYVIPYRNSVVVPESLVAEAVKQSFPQVESVDVARDGWQTLVVSITERKAVGVWCADTSNAEAPCYFIDKTGFIFDTGSAGAFITFSGKVEGGPVGVAFLGDRFGSLFSFITDVREATKRNPKSVTVDEFGDVEVTFDEGGSLKFALAASQKDTLDNIASVFASRRFLSGEKLDYADFRFGNKVYVKFLGE